MTTSTRTDPDLDSVVQRPRRRSLSTWCADRRWRTLLAALAVLVAAVLLLGSGMRGTESDDQLVGDSRAAEKSLSSADFGERPTENVVVSAGTGRLRGSEVSALAKEFRAAYAGLDGVAEVGSPVRAAESG